MAERSLYRLPTDATGWHKSVTCVGVGLHVYLCVLLTVAVWSGVNVAGTRLQDLHPDIGKPNDPENWNEVHRDVINRCASSCLVIISQSINQIKFI